MADPRWKPSEIELFFTERVDALSPGPPRFVDSTATVEGAIDVLQKEQIGSVLVRDAAGRLIGIFTERDVLTRVLGRDLNASETSITDVMTADPETLEQRATVAMALNKMHLGHYRHLPLVDEAGLPTGFVSVKDLVGHLAKRISEVST